MRKCSCGKPAGPTGLCTDCFLNRDPREGSLARPTGTNPFPTGIEAEVCADIAARQAKGIAKYGIAVADNPLSLREWLQHAYEETLDNAVYLKRAISELQRNGDAAGQEVEG